MEDDNPLILLHGTPGSPRSWESVASHLGSRVPAVPALSAPSVDAQLDDLAGLFGSGPVDLVGHSYGGVIALAAAMRWPDEVRRLVLVEPVAAFVLAHTHPDRWEESRRFFADYCTRVEGGDIEAVSIFVDYWFDPGTFELLPGGLQDYFRAKAPDTAVGVRAVLGFEPGADQFGALAAETLVLVGSLSPKQTKDICATLAELLPNASVQTVEGANHAMLETHPSSIAESLDV